MQRLYEQVILTHFQHHEQMLFLAGPRQVGKTTVALTLQKHFTQHCYLNFDIETDRMIILRGVPAIIERMKFHALHKQKPLLILDELHKYKHWKRFLKGLYDQYKSSMHILITGSAKLNIFQKGGDSLMGRYVLYRMHPLSVSELLKRFAIDDVIRQPKKLNQKECERLMQFGGFPDPYLKQNKRFLTQWNLLRRQQLFREDIRSLKQVQDIAHIEMLGMLLREQASHQINYSNLANALHVSADTVMRWINILEEFYYCFRIKPWHKNVKRSLVKEPKIYCWDWSEIKDEGARLENFAASHLHKAVQYWTDAGFGEYKLHYLRDKEKREVDFLVTRDNAPWFLVEIKSSDENLSQNLIYHQQQIKAPHAFQAVLKKSFVDIDCFSAKKPVIVPLMTFLSQLI
ncbi:MAG TPA: ATP-binding protein [Coxiellaceae bacterium]|nr:MAG: hypothetical protein A3E81_06120 [Gammaproteobacteria bacterium RIFCSPHIGHO2_12_FULL_36_30]HLB56875.1 ATP-binding protein [Coxiellaceae bacterium]